MKLMHGPWWKTTPFWAPTLKGIEPALLYIGAGHAIGMHIAEEGERSLVRSSGNRIASHEAFFGIRHLTSTWQVCTRLEQIMFEMVDGEDVAPHIQKLGELEDTGPKKTKKAKTSLITPYTANTNAPVIDPLDHGYSRLVPLQKMIHLPLQLRWAAMFQWYLPGSRFRLTLPWLDRCRMWGEADALSMEPTLVFTSIGQTDLSSVAQLSPASIRKLLAEVNVNGTKLCHKILLLAVDNPSDSEILTGLRALVSSSEPTQRTFWTWFSHLRIEARHMEKIRSAKIIKALHVMPWDIVKNLDTTKIRSLLLLGANKYDASIVRNSLVDHPTRCAHARRNSALPHLAANPFVVREACRKFIEKLKGLSNPEDRLEDWGERSIQSSVKNSRAASGSALYSPSSLLKL